MTGRSRKNLMGETIQREVRFCRTYFLESICLMNQEAQIALNAIHQTLKSSLFTVEKCLEHVLTVKELSPNTTEVIWSLTQTIIQTKGKLHKIQTALEASSGKK